MPFPLDIKFVKQAEAKLGRKLPLGYVVKVCRENGGGVTAANDFWFLYPIFDAVYWWDHETDELTQIADTFEELSDRRER